MPSSTLKNAILDVKFTFNGSDAADTIYGIWGDAPGSTADDYNSLLNGQGGDDVLVGNFANDVLLGGDGNDTLIGGRGDDWLDGGAGDDFVDGGSGNDTVLASAGNDTYAGGDGFDTLDFAAATTGLAIDISKGTASGGNFVAGFDSFEKVVGSAFGDNIKGSDRVDVIDGGAGDDVIRGKAGADILTGGDGHDTFVFFRKDAGQGVDVITDFKASDTIDLREFFKGSVASENADSVIHLEDTAEGTLVSAKIGVEFVNVALLQGVHVPTPDPDTAPTLVADLASDGIFML